MIDTTIEYLGYIFWMFVIGGVIIFYESYISGPTSESLHPTTKESCEERVMIETMRSGIHACYLVDQISSDCKSIFDSSGKLLIKTSNQAEYKTALSTYFSKCYCILSQELYQPITLKADKDNADCQSLPSSKGAQ